MRRALRLAALLLALAAAAPAWAQGAVQQLGPVTNGHLGMWVGPATQMDAGGSPGPGLQPNNNANSGTLPTGLGTVNSGLNTCAFTGYADLAYSELCWGFDGVGNALIQVDRVGDGFVPTCHFKINGVLIPCGGAGTVTSIAAAAPITVTPNPLTTTGTIGITIPGADLLGGNAGNFTAVTVGAGLTFGGGTLSLSIPDANLLGGAAGAFAAVAVGSGLTLAGGTLSRNAMACADLSNAGTACPADTGSSGHTLPFLDVENAWGAVQEAAFAALTISGATFTPDFGAAQAVAIQLVHASCPCTIANPTNLAVQPGHAKWGVLTITQSASGSDIVTWGADYKFANGVPPTLSGAAAAKDVFSWYSDDGATVIIGAGPVNAH